MITGELRESSPHESWLINLYRIEAPSYPFYSGNLNGIPLSSRSFSAKYIRKHAEISFLKDLEEFQKTCFWKTARTYWNSRDQTGKNLENTEWKLSNCHDFEIIIYILTDIESPKTALRFSSKQLSVCFC